MSARNRELLALIPVAVLVTGGFTAVFIVESSQIGLARSDLGVAPCGGSCSW